MNRRSRALRVVGALAIASLVAACSSSTKKSSTSSTSSSSSSASSAAQPTGAPIKVGLICSCSGPFGTQLVPVANVYRAWANTINGSGGINGHPIQIIYEDDAATPGTSISAIQTLIGDHVVALADASLIDQVWASTIQQAGIPVVGIDITNVPFYTNPDFYPEGQTNNSTTYANVVTAKQSGAKSLGDLYCAEAPTCAQGAPLIKAAGQQLGVPVIYEGSISATAPNYTAQCLAAEQAHVQALFIGDSTQVIARVATDCHNQGYDPTYITEGLGYQNLLQTTPGISDTLWSEYNTLPYWVTSSQYQAMNSAVDKYYPGVRTSTSWSQLAAMAWTSGVLLQDAVKAGGLAAGDTPSAAEITKGLTSLHGDTLGGMSPPLTFVAGQPHQINCWFTARLQSGNTVLLNNGKTTCQQ